MLITTIIAAYQDIKLTREAIESIYDQDLSEFEVLVCSDGDDDKMRESIENLNDYRIKYHFVDYQGQYGYRSKNEMTKIASGNIIIYLDQDNIIYRNCFKRILEEWEDDLGVLIFRIKHQVGIIPKANKIEHGSIDTLNGAFRTSVARQCEMKLEAPSADSLFFKQAEKICSKDGYRIKYITDILFYSRLCCKFSLPV